LIVMLCGRWITVKRQAPLDNALPIKTQSSP